MLYTKRIGILTHHDARNYCSLPTQSQQLFHDVITVPDVVLPPLRHGAALAHPPQRLGDWPRLVQLNLRKVLLDGIRGALGIGFLCRVCFQKIVELIRVVCAV